MVSFTSPLLSALLFYLAPEAKTLVNPGPTLRLFESVSAARQQDENHKIPESGDSGLNIYTIYTQTREWLLVFATRFRAREISVIEISVLLLLKGFN